MTSYVDYVIALVLGFVTGMMVSHPLARGRAVQQLTDDIEWVETCWPHKPVWTEGPGVCWINGEKVVVE